MSAADDDQPSGGNADSNDLDGRPVAAWLDELNAKDGAVRLRASVVLATGASTAVPEILRIFRSRKPQRMATLWGEQLLQMVYGAGFEEHRDVLQDAWFNMRGGVRRQLFEAMASDSLQLWIAGLCAQAWEIREESAMALKRLGPAAAQALPELEKALQNEEQEDAKLSMEAAIRALEGRRG